MGRAYSSDNLKSFGTRNMISKVLQRLLAALIIQDSFERGYTLNFTVSSNLHY